MIDVLGIHNESDGTIQARDQQKAVDEGDVIGDQKGAARHRHLLLSDDAQPVDGIGQQDEDQSQKGLRHEPHRPGCSNGRDEGCREENADGRKAYVGQDTATQRPQQDTGKDTDVFEGDDRSPPVVRCAPLYQGIDGNEDERTRHA